MKALNLYCGLGGNRKKWEDIDVTAVEFNPSIAKFYQDHYPQDRVIITDAHKFLLDNYYKFDFIWSSIECTTHSRARYWGSRPNKKIKPVFPDMKLYEEIIFLKHYFDGQWVVENVSPYYEPLLSPTIKIGRHLFWSNFYIRQVKFEEADIKNGNRNEWQKLHGIDITGYKFNVRTDKILRNCVNPDLGLHIFNCALKKESITQTTIFDLCSLE
jgi:DNA (cytosine-5)-methyltransferase 1